MKKYLRLFFLFLLNFSQIQYAAAAAAESAEEQGLIPKTLEDIAAAQCSKFLFKAIEENAIQTVRDILSVPDLIVEKFINLKNLDIETPLILAAKKGKSDIAGLLLETAAINVNISDPSGETALVWAVRKKYCTIAKQLIDTGANVNVGDRYDNPVIVAASAYGLDCVVHKLIQSGANVNAIDLFCRDTSLIWATRKRHAGIVRLILDAGADVNWANQHNQTALMVSEIHNYPEISTILIEAQQAQR